MKIQVTKETIVSTFGKVFERVYSVPAEMPEALALHLIGLNRAVRVQEEKESKKQKSISEEN